MLLLSSTLPPTLVAPMAENLRAADSSHPNRSEGLGPKAAFDTEARAPEMLILALGSEIDAPCLGTRSSIAPILIRLREASLRRRRIDSSSS